MIPLSIPLTYDALLDLSNFSDGTFFPLTGFMTESDYRCVIENMHLKNGQPWTIPISFEIAENQVAACKNASRIQLINQGKPVAEIEIASVYKIDPTNDLLKIFGTTDLNHPGVAKEMARSSFRVGGNVAILDPEAVKPTEKFYLSPAQTKAHFKNLGWQTITGFQTRNPIHRAHEYLQRVAMEITDGILIQPLVGWKKPGDITPESIFKVYDFMVRHFYPKDHAVLGCLRTNMRYAGPREAVFHAILRRNYGCTHFIVGRDHAGVGNYYGKYDAHKLCKTFNDLGIQILALCGPHYCKKCEAIVTEKTCPHGPEYEISVSGTEVRALINRGELPPEEFMRSEIANILIEMNQKNQLFIA